jgi:hypothetical protein
MRWLRVLLLAAGVLAAAGGCRNCDLVEAELRTRENDLRELRAELAHAESQNDALLRELHAIRVGSVAKVTPELASQTYTLKQITLGRGTGGYDDDNHPGDEAMQVVLEPRDSDGHAIKAPGSVHVEALEISPEGIKTPVSAWDVGPDQVRRSWHSGFLTTGYVFILPWKKWPSFEKIRVIVQFTLMDGRVFEADKDVRVHLIAPALRPAPPGLTQDGALPPQPVPETPLPAPRKLEPADGPTLSPTGWNRPGGTPPAAATTTVQWRPKAPPSLADAVDVMRPVALEYEPGAGPRD